MTSLEVFFILIIVGLTNVNAMSIKRSENNLEKIDENAYRVNYDVYPIVFPKRAAMLLDRLMVALHHALEDDDKKEVQRLSEIYRNGQLPPIPPTNVKQNVLPKYYKGKTESDAYYGYKLINGQTDDSEDMGGKTIEPGLRSGDYETDFGQNDDAMDLQRRGHSVGLDGSSGSGRVFWRCYFNAVTCF